MLGKDVAKNILEGVARNRLENCGKEPTRSP